MFGHITSSDHICPICHKQFKHYPATGTTDDLKDQKERICFVCEENQELIASIKD